MPKKNNNKIQLTDEAIKRKQLLLSVHKKKKILLRVTATCETLKGELESIKREYFLRVGNLLKRDNELDLEIISQKNLLALLKMGKSRLQAIESMKDSYFTETSESFADYTQVHNQPHIDEINKEELKALWKKVVMKFHPDLAVDPEEKKQREEIMKSVNKAYAEHDIEALREIYNHNLLTQRHELSLADIEKMLVQIENAILMVQKEIVSLKVSEWYSWKKKISIAKRADKDIFKELERSLLDDIVKKIEILKSIKLQTSRYK